SNIQPETPERSLFVREPALLHPVRNCYSDDRVQRPQSVETLNAAVYTQGEERKREEKKMTNKDGEQTGRLIINLHLRGQNLNPPTPTRPPQPPQPCLRSLLPRLRIRVY
ncbi:unnamed protein product, partial [Pleuronectes platessa]